MSKNGFIIQQEMINTLANIEEILENFAFIEDWEERYRYIIELGNDIATLSAEEKTDANKIRGCVSQVWLVYQVDAASPATIHFRGDSDAHIVRGLVAILMAAYSGKTASAILVFDIRKLFADLGLQNHLSPSRSSGFFSMIEHVRSLAAKYC